jgi:5-hydroxyisourate hydrolase
MSSLSTHVLDAARGEPAAAVRVQLFAADDRSGAAPLGTGETDGDGRITDLAPADLAPGSYRLVFATGPYFTAAGVSSFYPEVTITFTVDEDRHYHVPLLLSPYAYSTYRGS